MFNSPEAEKLFYEASAHLHQGAYNQAIAKLSRAIALDQQSMYYFARGRIHAINDNLSQAQSDFETAILRNTGPIEALIGALTGLGFIAELRREYHMAVSYFTRAIKLDPKAALLYIRRSEILRESGNIGIDLAGDMIRSEQLTRSGEDTSGRYMIF